MTLTLKAAEEWWTGFGDPYMRTLELDPLAELGNIWDVSWDSDGVAYIGAERLWRWDGSDWKLIEGDKLFNIRAMSFSEDGKLWLASHGEFGVLDPRTLKYESRMDWFPEEHRGIGEVWKLHQDGDEFWIGTEYRLFRVSESGFDVWEFSGEHRIIFHFLPSGVYAHQAGEGLWRLEGESMQLVSTDPDLAEKSVLYMEENDDGQLLAVSGKGVFELEIREDWVVDSVLDFKRNLFISSIIRDNASLLLGTLGDGVLVLNNYRSSNIALESTRRTIGKTVINLQFDNNDCLWILSTEGIDILYQKYPLRIVDEIHSYPVGYITSLMIDSEGVGVGTNRGYFIYDASSVNYKMDSLTKAEVYQSASSTRGRLLNSYDKIFVVENGDLKLISDFNRSIRNFTLSSAGHLYVSFSDRVGVYRWNHDDSLDEIAEHPIAVTRTSLDADGLGNVWGWSVKTPLTRIYLDGEGESRIEQIEEVAGVDLLKTQYSLYVVEGGPVIVAGDRLIRRQADGSWQQSEHDLGLGLPLAHTFREGEDGLEGWLVYQDPELNTSLLVEMAWPVEGDLMWRILPWVDMQSLGRIREIELAEHSPDTLIIAGSRGLLLAPLELSERIRSPGKPVIWDRTQGDTAAMYKVLPFGELKFNYKFSSPNGDGFYPVRYQTRLSGLEPEWTDPVVEPIRGLGQLFEGEYVFEVRAVDPFGRISPAARVGLKVRPPLLRSPYAYILYVFVFVMLILLIVLLQKAYHRRRQRSLEALVELRTKELAAASEVKDNFIANLSHEIRNPLNGVIGLIRLLSPEKAPPARNLESLKGAADYLAETVEDVLDFSRLESGSIEVELKPLNLLDTVEGVISAYQPQAEEKGLRIIRDYAVEGTCQVISDKRMLGQILGNLLSNAIKFTADGTIRIGIELEPAGKDQYSLQLMVEDSGCGIPEADREHVFEKFFQSRGSGAKTKGTGLGLTLVNAFVGALDGSLGMESEMGRGTRFTVRLPVAVEAVDSMPLTNEEGRPPCRPQSLAPEDDTEVVTPGTHIQPQESRVLLVEDMEYNSLVMEELLGRMGFAVDTVADGRRGLEAAMARPYAAIFLDWDLPGMHGLEVARELVRSGALQGDTVIIGMSAMATEDMRDRCLEAGMDTFLGKPIDEAKLRAVVEEWVTVIPESCAFTRDAGPNAENCDASRVNAQLSEDERARGMLGEMSGTEEEWQANKLRWMGIFEEHVAALESEFGDEDIECIRRQAHKLLGHVRMVQVDDVLPEALVGIQEAARAGDLDTMREQWAVFESGLAAFRDAMERL